LLHIIITTEESCSSEGLTDEVKDLEGGEVLVDLAHEALHEDDLRETDGHAAQVAGEGVHVVEVVQLHGVGEV